MRFRVRLDPVALRQIEEFAAYLRDYSENFAIEQIERLDCILAINLRESPLTLFCYPVLLTAATCFGSGAAPNIG